eukprot:TRINITY_DN26077_c0_g1_i1.p2 TRINITY_DN26077_c0_g1~~TRINITY_DN26077_c0_g1_i1.p2  ORF type:complete len:168 (-),score=46.80 TRINITY_DN26077_c0_g1_i1:108-578(-)
MSTHTNIQFETKAKMGNDPLDYSDEEVKAAYDAVVSDKDDTCWAIFGYVKGENKIKVVETGTDPDIEDLKWSLSEGKALFIWLKYPYDDRGTSKSKLIYITWAPDGLPTIRKGLMHAHADQFGTFLKGMSIQLNARNEDDISADLIQAQIDKTCHY